jgi:hypothetical protein
MKFIAHTGAAIAVVPIVGREDWVVVASRTRDDDTHVWNAFQDKYARRRKDDPKGKTFEYYRLRHWAVGWIDVLIVPPKGKKKEVLDERSSC